MSNLGGTLRNQDWSSVKLTAFEKNFYVEDKAVAQRSDREIEDFRREKEIRGRVVLLRELMNRLRARAYLE